MAARRQRPLAAQGVTGAAVDCGADAPAVRLNQSPFCRDAAANEQLILIGPLRQNATSPGRPFEAGLRGIENVDVRRPKQMLRLRRGRRSGAAGGGVLVRQRSFNVLPKLGTFRIARASRAPPPGRRAAAGDRPPIWSARRDNAPAGAAGCRRPARRDRAGDDRVRGGRPRRPAGKGRARHQRARRARGDADLYAAARGRASTASAGGRLYCDRARARSRRPSPPSRRSRPPRSRNRPERGRARTAAWRGRRISSSRLRRRRWLRASRPPRAPARSAASARPLASAAARAGSRANSPGSASAASMAGDLLAEALDRALRLARCAAAAARARCASRRRPAGSRRGRAAPRRPCGPLAPRASLAAAALGQHQVAVVVEIALERRDLAVRPPATAGRRRPRSDSGRATPGSRRPDSR